MSFAFCVLGYILYFFVFKQRNTSCSIKACTIQTSGKFDLYIFLTVIEKYFCISGARCCFHGYSLIAQPCWNSLRFAASMHARATKPTMRNLSETLAQRNTRCSSASKKRDRLPRFTRKIQTTSTADKVYNVKNGICLSLNFDWEKSNQNRGGVFSLGRGRRGEGRGGEGRGKARSAIVPSY